MVGENFEFICLKLLELPKEPRNNFHDFGHFPKKTFNNTEQISHSLSGLNSKWSCLQEKKSVA